MQAYGGLEVELHLLLACSQDGEWSNLHSGSLRQGNSRYSHGKDRSHIELLQDGVQMWSVLSEVTSCENP
jgi:hypothetical protein